MDNTADDLDGHYIYESPDGGKTVYKRHFGGHQKDLVFQQTQDLFNYGEFLKMMEAAKTNTSLNKALENLRLIYYTVKDE
jgi:hypothetical protein